MSWLQFLKMDLTRREDDDRAQEYKEQKRLYTYSRDKSHTMYDSSMCMVRQYVHGEANSTLSTIFLFRATSDEGG